MIQAYGFANPDQTARSGQFPDAKKKSLGPYCLFWLLSIYLYIQGYKSISKQHQKTARERKGVNMKIKSDVNVVGVNCEHLDLFRKEVKYFKIGGEKNFKEFIFDVVICHNKLIIQQSILSDIVYINTSTLMDYERIIEWLNANAEVFE